MILPVGLTEEEMKLLDKGLNLAAIHGEDEDLSKFNTLRQKLRVLYAGYKASQPRLRVSQDPLTFQPLGGTLNGRPLQNAAMKLCECEGVNYSTDELRAGIHTACGGLLA